MDHSLSFTHSEMFPIYGGDFQPGFSQNWRSTVHSQLNTLLQDLHSEATSQVTACLQHHKLAAAAKHIRRQFVLSTLDKDNGKPVLVREPPLR